MHNINQTTLLVSSIQGFLLVLGLMTKRTTNKLSSVAIAMLVFVITITLLFSWGSATKYNNSENAIPFWVLHSYSLIPASIWLFFEVNTNPKFKFSKKYMVIFLPTILDIIFQTAFRQFPENRIFVSVINSPYWFFSSETIPLAATVVTLSFYARKLWQIRKRVQEFKNSDLSFYLKKMSIIASSMCFLLLVWAASTYNIVQFKTIESILVCFIFLLGYVAYFNSNFFEVPKRVLVSNQVGKVFPYFDDEIELSRLNSIFTEKSLHLRPRLTVSELANEMNLSTKYISYLIANYHDKNFNDFVNGFRVKEVIRKITDINQRHKSLLGIAFDSGFNSKSSFNEVFKQHTGKTPSQYLS